MRRGEGGGEGEIERGREGGEKNNGVLRGLVLWIFISQLVCVCVCVCARARAHGNETVNSKQETKL